MILKSQGHVKEDFQYTISNYNFQLKLFMHIKMECGNDLRKDDSSLMLHTSPPCSKTVSSTTSLSISMERQKPMIQSRLPMSSP